MKSMYNDPLIMMRLSDIIRSALFSSNRVSLKTNESMSNLIVISYYVQSPVNFLLRTLLYLSKKKFHRYCETCLANAL